MLLNCLNKHVLVQSALKWEAFSTKFAVKLQLSMGVPMFVKWGLGAEIFVTFGTLHYTIVLFMVDVEILHILHLIFLHLGMLKSASLGQLEPSVSTCNVASLFMVTPWSTSKVFSLTSVFKSFAVGFFLTCLRPTGLMTNVFAVSIKAFTWLINWSVLSSVGFFSVSSSVWGSTLIGLFHRP